MGAGRGTQNGVETVVDPRRVRVLREGSPGDGPVAYWMSRDQRAADNWALLFAQQLALQRQSSLVVVFCLVAQFLGATRRQYGFLLRGLQGVERSLAEWNIPFRLLRGSPGKELPAFVGQNGISQLVTDFDPLRIKRGWKDGVASAIDIPFFEVDAHNIIPCWVASPKQEYAAYTMRPKIHRALPEFLQPFPSLERHPWPWAQAGSVDWPATAQTLRVDESVPEVGWLEPGEKAGREVLQDFLQSKLRHYVERRNDPTQDGQSNLSPYLHFGHLSAQRVALEVDGYSLPHEVKADFFEELVVRRELSDNYCFYNPHYDSSAGFPDWCQKTLDAHRHDPRKYVYSPDEFERAQTHDELWNAAQMEMVTRGKMHGYMRMYWAKKVLEWSASPEEALGIAIDLNDKYELDGRDPSGYTGIAWSIGGVHDRPWKERTVFGKIRYMSYGGAKRKFDVQGYVRKHLHGQH
jgi:deoxyribodipyrimidine photo-lyase